MTNEKLDPDFADLPPTARAEIEGSLGIGLHHAPAVPDVQVTGDAFHHPEKDAAGTTWEPDWQPMETYRDGDVVMLDDGERQMLGRRKLGMWMELTGGEELAQPDFLPMLWSIAPEQIKYDML
ncbi:hypothetical protein [Sphingomonas sp. BAUL-RG-20F-R05-02]|uniref:hypothetical protein n=1 Tax=Sphingomonas sp. BAUL-RG-20F-R05-02 TaxID=2914830 RepID=UPI001F57CE9D|nr:hypothetical protein [Sphingomonas sp. BAUL-RG-20F-R05-02]